METLYIKIGLAVIFTFAVISKLTGKTKSTFENAGLGSAAMYATAIAEVILTVMLFTKFELWATLGLLAIIAGAIFTLVRQRAKPTTYTMAIITAVLLSVLLYILVSKNSFSFENQLFS